jgi:hypothetical protein
MNWQTASVAIPTIAANFRQSFDIHMYLTSQIALHHQIGIYELAKLRDVCLAQIFHTRIRIDAGLSQ